MSGKIKPIVTKVTDRSMNSERLDHPAFGVIKLFKVSSSGENTLFGSNVNHRDFVRIDIQTAHVDRSLHRDWVHSDKTIVSLEMTFAQWAQFVSSMGDGTGTQVTLDKYRTGDLFSAPQLARLETVRENFKREVENKASEYIKEASDLHSKLVALISNGKANKTQLNELLGVTHQLKNNMPKNMAFIQESLEEAMEKTIEASKSDIEGFIMGKITNAGLESLLGHAPTAISFGGEDE